ncbi:hypothetical protein OH76DRAFT_1488152 [Lentinus brumalis]|uniref:Cupredoxin n=1 Tax=Lentinus brumalis TaxID=2498619 RepID=A0A371CRY6_9APHY|nr:hypothetical protein OH76DRAFT_1488152 [Polyporus brumalis]
MRVATAFSTLAFAAVAIAQSNTIINVGEISGNPTFWFDPPHVNVTEVNSTVTFIFRKPGNHTVAQSSYAKPCEPLDGGFNSGFFFVDSSSGTGTWNLTITDVNTPIWFYCAQQISEVHCELGMVGVINPPATGDAFDQFVYRANAATTVVYPSTALTGIGAFATAAVQENTQRNAA